MLRKINARTLLKFTTEDLWKRLTGPFILVFDDGELETTAKETLYSAYAWRFHQVFPETPLLKKHHISSTLKTGTMGSKTHLNFLGDVMWDVHSTYKDRENEVELRDHLARMVYQITNTMYSDLSYHVEADVVSIDIVDFIEIVQHPDIAPVLASITPDQAGIDRAYGAITAVITSPTKLPNNPVVKAVRAGLVDRNQVLQSIGPRGFLTDIDSVIFKTPVTRGYVQGFRKIYELMVESRSSAKALYFSKSPLEDAEYFSRKLQLLCQVVTTLHPGDCGSDHYLTWHMRGPEKDEAGLTTYKGDLPYLEGKYYMDEESQTLKAIAIGDKHLYGRTLQIRSVVAGCNHPDPHGFCATCFGELALSVPENSNIGHMCATSMTEKSSQSVLSVKHSDGNAVINGIILPKEFQAFLATTPDGYSYLLSQELKGKGVKLIVQQVEALGLTDLAIVSDVNDLNITRVSSITDIAIKTTAVIPTTGEIVEDGIVIPVSLNKRLASFTYEFLAYIKEHSWEPDDKANVVIDMAKWDWTKPIMTLPLKHFNMGDHSEDIAKIIESRVDDMQARSLSTAPVHTLYEFFDLVNSKLNVNLAVLETIIYAAMAVDPLNNNFNLPKPWTAKALGVSGSTIPGRSLPAAMAWERHRDTIINPASFFSEHRPSHPMDVFVMPEEAVQDGRL